MIWLILATIAGYLLALAFLILARYSATQANSYAQSVYSLHQQIQFEQKQTTEARAQRDRLNERCATLAQRLAEADAQLDLQVHQIHGLMEERKSLQAQLQEALKPRKRRAGQAVTTGEDGER